MNDGLRTWALLPIPRASPRTKRVFPAPSPPDSTITSPVFTAGPRPRPSRSVSSSDREVCTAPSITTTATYTPLGVSVTSGRIISSTDTPPCWNEPRNWRSYLWKRVG